MWLLVSKTACVYCGCTTRHYKQTDFNCTFHLRRLWWHRKNFFQCIHFRFPVLCLLVSTVAHLCVSQLTDEQKQSLLDLHNRARSMVDPIATDMEEMVSCYSQTKIMHIKLYSTGMCFSILCMGTIMHAVQLGQQLQLN